jgi:hypothetical protein
VDSSILPPPNPNNNGKVPRIQDAEQQQLHPAKNPSTDDYARERDADAELERLQAKYGADEDIEF